MKKNKQGNALDGLSELEIAKKRVDILATHQFITRDDLQILLGQSRSKTNKFFNAYKGEFLKNVEEKGQMFPFENYLPINFILEKLSYLGITRNNIISNYKLSCTLLQA